MDERKESARGRQYQLVPKEPTQEMLDAADKIIDCDPQWLAKAYRAMLAAAPTRRSPSLERVREVLKYDAETGEFSWKEGKAPGKKSIAPRIDGYVWIWLDGSAYAAHRMAWFMQYGEWPEQYIDHINGDKADNRIANLRDVSHQANMHNSRTYRTNTSGYPGVGRNGSGWRAEIRVAGKKRCLGTFPTKEEAHQAYVRAKAQVLGGLL